MVRRNKLPEHPCSEMCGREEVKVLRHKHEILPAEQPHTINTLLPGHVGNKFSVDLIFQLAVFTRKHKELNRSYVGVNILHMR